MFNHYTEKKVTLINELFGMNNNLTEITHVHPLGVLFLLFGDLVWILVFFCSVFVTCCLSSTRVPVWTKYEKNMFCIIGNMSKTKLVNLDWLVMDEKIFFLIFYFYTNKKAPYIAENIVNYKMHTTLWYIFEPFPMYRYWICAYPSKEFILYRYQHAKLYSYFHI